MKNHPTDSLALGLEEIRQVLLCAHALKEGIVFDLSNPETLLDDLPRTIESIFDALNDMETRTKRARRALRNAAKTYGGLGLKVKNLTPKTPAQLVAPHGEDTM